MRGLLSRAKCALSKFSDPVLKLTLPAVDVCIAHEFHAPPYGGGNQFCLALAGELERLGFSVSRGLSPAKARCCMFNSFNFDQARLRALKQQFARRVHRVDGPVDVYRGSATKDLDKQIHACNREFAHATIFQSQYSLQKHLELGLEFVDPSVIPNAVDAEIFHSTGRLEWTPGRKTRLISTSWSDNPNKGGPFFSDLEKKIDWSRYEWTFIGNTRTRFEKIKTLPPCDSLQLAEHLRQSDIYIIASKHEPCSNALMEALSCGLPACYLNSGSHAELVRDAGRSFNDADDAVQAIDDVREHWQAYQARIACEPMASIAQRYAAVFFKEPNRC